MKYRSIIAGAILFFSLAATTLPRLVALIDNALALRPLRYEARRERQMGAWYSSIENLRSKLAKNESVALVTAPRDTDAAVFANYYLYPTRTRMFVGRNGYRNAANDPGLPKKIVAVSSDRVEETTYDALRDRDLRDGHRVIASPQLSELATTFVLPIVASLDGATPETFVTEATIVNPNPTAAEVHVTFWPKGMTRTITIAPGATTSYYDFLHQLFGITDRGWMRVESSLPLRAAFYFANRGRSDATLLPNATKAATGIVYGPLYRDSKLFLINPSDKPVNVVIAEESIPINPHAFVSWPIAKVPAVSGDVYVFVTTRELNGRTDFLWPR